MKKKIVIISIALPAFAVALTGNSWAAREKGGGRHVDRRDRLQPADEPVRDHDNRDRFHGRGCEHFPGRDFVRPGPRLRHKTFKRHSHSVVNTGGRMNQTCPLNLF